MHRIARVPVQQHDPGLNGSSELDAQANLREQYWQIGQVPAVYEPLHVLYSPSLSVPVMVLM